jgi:ribosomal protein S18 acetylase RimI-like enzyme
MRLQLPSYSLTGDNDELLGFGQYYLREGRCHLARLVISPDHRSRAAGAFLIRELCQLGCNELPASECSLFVMEFNTPAVRLYARLGFSLATYPGEPLHIERCVYMVASSERIIGQDVI